MQKKIKISHNLEILLPVYEYYTSKTKINNVGIIPDIVVNDKLMDDWVKKYENRKIWKILYYTSNLDYI